MLRPGMLVVAIAVIVVAGPLCPVARGQTKKEQAEVLAAPAADAIATEFLEPAVRQAVANGVATLVARMTAEGNDSGLAFPPFQKSKLIEVVEVPAKRVRLERGVYEHEYAEVEKIVPIMQSGQPTGRFTKKKQRVVVKSRQVGTTTVERLVPDKDGSEKMRVGRYGPGGPAAWAVNLPGLNGMALYVLAKAGLAKHPATIKHAAALAAHASDALGLPDATFDVAWMAAGFAALGPDSKHGKVTRRLVGKLIDGQVREKGDLDGLWGPVCVNYGYYGKLMTVGQTVRQEVDVVIPKKMEKASPAEQRQLVAMGQEMKAFASSYDRVHRDVFRAGTRMLEIQGGYLVDEWTQLPGLPFNAYQWVVTDVESTDAAAFALAVAKQADLLPRETERLAIRGKKIHPPVKTDAVITAAAKRMAAAIGDDGGATALALVAKNTGYDKTGFPAPSFASPDAMPSMFDLETACTTVAAYETLESLVAIDPKTDEQLAELRKLARDRAAAIAARWYAESASPTAKAWRGMYVDMKVSHADLAKSGVLEVPAASGSDVGSLPWGPSGCLYRIVPDFRGLFAGRDPKNRFSDDLFRRIAYRLVALQDQNGQWSASGAILLSTANESLAIGRVAANWHRLLNRDPPLKIPASDPASYAMMLSPWPDSGSFPTLASLLFLVESIDGPVSIDGIAVLPETADEPEEKEDADAGKQPTRLMPEDAVRRVVRPNVPRQELFEAILATRWPRMKASGADTATVAQPDEDDAADAEAAVEEKAEEEEDALGKAEDFLQPAAPEK